MTRRVCDEDKSRDMAGNSSATGGGGGGDGFCYSDNNPATVLVSQMEQGFVTDPEMFNLATGIEMIGFSKTTDTNNASSSVMWKSFFAKSSPTGQHHDEAGPSSSKTMNNDSSSTIFYPHHHQYNNNNRQQDFTSGISETTSSENNNLIVGSTHHHDSSSSAPWQQDHSRMLVDDSSFRCVFPCEGNERPSQGLSLSLSSNNPSSIGLQSFELRQTSHHNHHQMLFQEQGYLNPSKGSYQGHFLLRNSKFLVPAQDLLNEFCSLGTRQSEVVVKQKNQNNKQWEDQGNNGASGGGSSKKHPLSSLEFLELQKRKTKLLAMLEEVDRRYKHYCNQMRMVVSSFEAVAGNGAATVYSALALKAMSRHFRCLKDGILDQIQTTRKGMGEKDPVAPGATRGETPRLRVIDQVLRQQRAFQQMSMMETHPWRPQRGLPERSVSILRAWLFEHFLHPYPSDVDKHILARQTGLSRSQVSNWFINARVRLWKPMVEEMYLEEAKDDENNMASSDGGTNTDDVQDHYSPNSTRLEDHKPTQARLLRIDSECVSSIINNKNNHPDYKDDPIKSRKSIIHNMMNPSHDDQQFPFGSVEIDFSSYDHHHHSTPGMVSYNTAASNDHNNGNHHHHHQGFNGGAVSLTLGLQQHGGNGGVSLAFPPAAADEGSMLYSREQIEECQPVVHQYSLLDGEGQSMSYRNLMGTQLLHDLAN